MGKDAHAATRRRRSTQIDIAREAGVSQATVSLVLNDAPEARTRIPQETRDRVLAVAKQLGYSPNPAAQSLVGGRNYLLGFHTFEEVFPSDQRDFYFPFLLGVEREATRQGYDLLLFSPSSAARKGGAVRPAASRLLLADGCILLGRHVDRDALSDLTRNDFPLVFIGRREIPDADIAYVGIDYETATRKLVERLIELGHTRLGYIGEPGGGEQNEDRLKGYFDGVAQLGADNNGSLKHSKPLTTAELKSWIDRGVTAVLVEPGEDDSNVRALETAAAELSLSIPGDLSVAVVGDPEFATTDRADWTHFGIKRDEIAQRAVQLLVAILDDVDEERHVLIESEIVTGATMAARQPR
ncbi:MAG: transcriptional regulator, LacI family [Candidatus Kaiserbacteria bacterium]|nr:transcriptional regulator, LacI family [Candidatus Kaiserbacteria bacterium]